MKPAAIKVLKTCHPKNLTSIAERDFFGIADITSKDIAGALKSVSKLPEDKFRNKYHPLTRKREAQCNETVEKYVSFGSMRFDEENQPKIHGQFEPTFTKKKYETTDIKKIYIPDNDNDNHIVSTSIIEEEKQSPKSDLPEGYNEPYKIIDVEPTISFSELINAFKQTEPKDKLNCYANKPPLEFLFERTINPKSNEEQVNKEVVDSIVDKLSGRSLDEEDLEETIFEASNMQDKKAPLVHDMQKEKPPPVQDLDPESAEMQEYYKEMDKEQVWNEKLDEKYDVKYGKPKELKNALEYLKQVRAGRIEPTAKGLKHRLNNENPYSFKPDVKLDSKGFRNYTNQVPNWNATRHVDILKFLEKSIVYNAYGILAVNKPYGIASHEEEKSRESIDMNSLMTELAPKLRIEKLHLAHRLDKTTSGVLLFATNQEQARNLNKLFKSDQIKKTYWSIVRGEPEIPHAIIDIPIGEYAVGGKTRSCVCPDKLEEFKQLSKKYKEAKRAITEYEVLGTYKGASLIEVKPRTGVKHQIRCHLSMAIECPILGDHKYSHIGKVAPQVLPVPMLKLLRLRQPKVRTLPVHLHAKTVVIPGVKANGETLFIHAPLPPHFIENLKSLKLFSDYVAEQIKN